MTDKPVLWHNPENVYDITATYDPEYHQGWIPLYAAPVGAEHFLKAIAALREGIATCRAEALEEAAKVCDEYHVASEYPGYIDCAAAIRGLK